MIRIINVNVLKKNSNCINVFKDINNNNEVKIIELELNIVDIKNEIILLSKENNLLRK